MVVLLFDSFKSLLLFHVCCRCGVVVTMMEGKGKEKLEGNWEGVEHWEGDQEE